MSTKHPKIIKRYQNRKLYDTSDSCYVTLEDISEMIKEGEEIQIVDNTTKEDLTAVTLAQIIFEEQKKKTNVLPLGTFRQIIQGGGEALREIMTRGAHELGHVREFVDSKVKPAVENIQSIPTVQAELDAMKRKIEALEKKLSERDRRR
ncbi:MAG TPA: polyhydroxyalkanoate synthesis regulator DNA-binding domain-containing protein [bacterium]|nr:polyhydroxyalkanoate synthesis regulator DNA-binding domain-containing protein [bacterium]